tara:strand:- start:8691 stop:9857 length:1167 start_codon:yes stop_codon:yes gene_type:complete
MANRPIWPGSSSFVPGDTPFGFYDNDSSFQADADKVAKYIAIKLGYPIMDVELIEDQMYACFEESVAIYAEELYQSKIKDNYISLEGAPTASQLNDIVVGASLQNIINISDTYGQAAMLGGNVDRRSGSLSLIAGQQVYDLQAWGIQNNYIDATDRMVIQTVFYQGVPAINQYYDPYIGGSINYQGATENFGWASYSPGLNFVLFPVYWDIQRIQEIEMSNTVRRSAFSFEIVNNKLKIFPRPEIDNAVVWIEYSKKSDSSNVILNSPYGANTGLVSNASKAPYGNITYAQINQPGKQWIYEYALALASEILGLVRGKYSEVPIPGSEVTLNGADLISKGKETQLALRDKLRQDFEDMSRRSQLERKQSEQASLSDTLKEVPLLIYIG